MRSRLRASTSRIDFSEQALKLLAREATTRSSAADHWRVTIHPPRLVETRFTHGAEWRAEHAPRERGSVSEECSLRPKCPEWNIRFNQAK